jgi:hypothetical protein
MVRKIRSIALVVVITLVLLEATLLVAVRVGLLDMPLPTYSMSDVKPYAAPLDPVFGIWHVANARKRHVQGCFDVTYSANSFGMRDREVALRSAEPRVVVLGDSFVEGFGVEYGKRLTERLEDLTGIEHLNFGLRGASPTGEYLIYQRLASRFDHDAVMLMILPRNDFTEDEPTPSALGSWGFYRPYLVGEYPNYRVTLPARKFPEGPPAYEWGNLLTDYSMVAQAANYAYEYLHFAVTNLRAAGETFGPARSYYFDYTPAQFDRLRYVVEQIKGIAGDRPVLIATMAGGRADYTRAAKANVAPPLRLALADLARKLDVDYVDLMQAMPDPQWSRYFLSCNEHWGDYGNQAAAEAIASFWSYYDRQKGGVTPAVAGH